MCLIYKFSSMIFNDFNWFDNKGHKMESASLQIQVRNYESSLGALNVRLYAQSEKLNVSRVFREEIFTYHFIDNGKVRIKDIPFGRYIISVFHDENCNGSIDMDPNGNILESLVFYPDLSEKEVEKPQGIFIDRPEMSIDLYLN